MFTYELALAAALLAAPLDSASDWPLPAWTDGLLGPVRQAALGLELLDPRESHCSASQRSVFAAELRVLQERFEDLARAPLLEECSRFPNREVANEYLFFNRAYRRDVAVQLSIALVHSANLQKAQEEADRLFRVWEALRNAQSPCYYVVVRRQDLQLLRDLVGAEAFYTGQLPPHVPTWRFPVER